MALHCGNLLTVTINYLCGDVSVWRSFVTTEVASTYLVGLKHRSARTLVVLDVDESKRRFRVAPNESEKKKQTHTHTIRGFFA